MNELTQEEILFIIEAIQHSQQITNGHNWDDMAATVIEKIY